MTPVKNCTCYYSDDTTKIEDFNFEHILIDRKSYKNVLVYDFLLKILLFIICLWKI